MIGLVRCSLVLVLLCKITNAVTYYPEAGFGGGLGYGEKLEYGPGVYGVSTHYGYKAPIAPGVASAGIAYSGEGIAGLPRAAGLGYGYEGLKYGPVGGVGITKPVYEPAVGYQTVGIGKGIAPIYGPGPVAPIGLGAGIGGYSGIGLGLGQGKYLGGEAVDHNVYSSGNQNLNDEQYVKSHGVKGEAIDHGDVGYTNGNVALKNIKGDSVHFVDANGGNAAHHSGQAFHGGEHYGKEGKHGGEQVLKEGFKKGHNIKSFKKSHHLDETGKTEEYYDENHDEGGNVAFNGQSGIYGESGASSFKGGHEDGKYNSGEAKKEGHYDNEYVVDKSEAGHGKFGGNKYAQNEEAFGAQKGIGEHGLAGHHQFNNYYKKFPFYY